MLKRASILLLCLVYTVSVYGIAFSVNYCGTEVESVKIGAQTARCHICHARVKMKCCKTKHIVVKVKDAHLANDNVWLAKVFTFAAIVPNYISFVPVWQQAYAERITYHGQNAPPPDKDLTLIKNRSFRI